MSQLHFNLRPAELDDLPGCLEIDTGYVTNYVWQMEEGLDNSARVEEANGDKLARPKILGKGGSPTPNSYQTTFRPSRLPRPMVVAAPFNDQSFLNNWRRTDYLLVAETIPGEPDLGQPSASPVAPLEPLFPKPQLIGYIGLQVDRDRHIAWVNSFAVQQSYRRRGVGRQLWRQTQAWVNRHRLPTIMVELETKNFPAIQFFQQQGFFFCGYNSAFHLNREIALFFGYRLGDFA
jgi:ribosomal protein S18 acetylase RimI-like enzyme